MPCTKRLASNMGKFTDITHANWFGGYYQEVRNQFATFATDPESWLRIYSKEFELPDDQKKAWQEAMRPTYAWAKGRVGQEVLDLIAKELDVMMN